MLALLFPSWLIPAVLILGAFLFLGLRETGDRVTNVLYALLFSAVVVLIFNNSLLIPRG